MYDELAAQVLRRDPRTMHAKASSQAGQLWWGVAKAVTCWLVPKGQLESEQNFCSELYLRGK